MTDKQPRCQGCGEFVNPNSSDVTDDKIPNGPRITDHKNCIKRMQEKAFAEAKIEL